MKITINKNLLLFGFVFAILISCQDFTPPNNGVDLSKIENVKSLKNEAQRLSFNLLNEREKLFIWDQHFQDVMRLNAFSQTQVQLILELKKINNDRIMVLTAISIQRNIS